MISSCDAASWIVIIVMYQHTHTRDVPILPAPSQVSRSQTRLGMARTAEGRKRNKYKEVAQKHKCDFKAWVVETSGALGEEAREIQRIIARSAAQSRLSASEQQVLRDVKQEMAISLKRGNALAVSVGLANSLEAASTGLVPD